MASVDHYFIVDRWSLNRRSLEMGRWSSSEGGDPESIQRTSNGGRSWQAGGHWHPDSRRLHRSFCTCAWCQAGQPPFARIVEIWMNQIVDMIICMLDISILSIIVDLWTVHLLYKAYIYVHFVHLFVHLFKYINKQSTNGHRERAVQHHFRRWWCWWWPL